MNDPSRSILLSMIAVAATLLFTTSCSLVLSLQECESNSDCDEGFRCTADALCEVAVIQEEETPECRVDIECGIGNECNAGECQATAGGCVEDSDCPETNTLLAAPCDQAVGDVDADDSFVIGVLLPLSGPEEGFGRPLFQSIQLAQSDFNGIGGVNNRDIALLICDTEGLDQLALESAQYLADSGIQAIIGPDYSSQTLQVATEVTIPNEMVLVSPSATAASISDLDDDNLVWRTAASDAVQGQALGELVNFLVDEQPHRSSEERLDAPKIAILARSSDPYSNGLQRSLTHVLPASITGSDAQFTTYEYPNIGAGNSEDYTSLIDELLSEPERSEIIVILGSSEAWTLAALIDDQLNHAPLYILADAGRNSSAAANVPDELRGRVWGTAPQNLSDTNYGPYLTFRVKYEAAYNEAPDAFQFAANAFDALYILAFGAAFGGFEGPGIAEGIVQLSSGDSITPNQSQVQTALRTLVEGTSIDYQGASGPLDFDENGDPLASPTLLWCFDDVTLPEAGVILDVEFQFHRRICGEYADIASDSGEPCTGVFDFPICEDACFDPEEGEAYCTTTCDADFQCPTDWTCSSNLCCSDC